MPSVLSEIKHWATQLPYWEQAALDRLLSNSSLTHDDYEELLSYLLEDEGLAIRKKQRPGLSYVNVMDTEQELSSRPIILNRLFNLQNINALVSGQTLNFCPKLTAIYGDNGSGKSGYARVLGCAGFTRGDTDVLPDITKPVDSDIIRSADIEISDSNSTKVINYHVGGQHPELSQCYVFDSTSVQVHLTGSNTFSFSPAGLSILTRLSEYTDRVRQHLQLKINDHRKMHNFEDLFQGSTQVTDFIKTLSPTTTLEELDKLATLSEKENNRIKHLDFEISSLKTVDAPKQNEAMRGKIEDLEKLVKHLEALTNNFDTKAIDDINQSIQQYEKREILSQTLSIEQFKSDYFSKTGSEVWNNFINAARALGDEESSEGKKYPDNYDRCLLCRQVLDTESRNFLINLWQYMKSDAQLKLDQSQHILQNKRDSLSTLNINYFNDQAVSFRHLQEYDVELLGKVKAFVDNCQNRRELILERIDSHKQISLSALPTNEIPKITNKIDELKSELLKLEQRDVANKIIELGQELLVLQHRQIFSKNLPRIKDYIDNIKWAKRASSIGGNTGHITKKYKELFEDIVSDRYIELFKATLYDLQRLINVQVKTIGKKGKTLKQIVLEMDPTVNADLVTPDKVLSEGEKRAVALADFLTEVALDTSSSAIILDDPVTSLDFQWKEKIATILTKESVKRQVIIFTHDLAFLYLVKKCAEENSVDITTHWIQKIENIPGYVFLNNSPALEKEYCKATRARELYKKSKDSAAEEREYYLRLGFGALRTCYEAFIIYELFQGVVLRFDVRVSPGRLRDIKWDNTIAKEVNSKYEYISKFIEGHLQADGYTPKPDVPMLLTEIESFELLRKKHNNLV